MSEDDLLALVLEARPHLIRASMETEAYLSRLEQRHDELNELVERLFRDDSAAAANACGILWSLVGTRPHEQGARVPRARLPGAVRARGFSSGESGRLRRPRPRRTASREFRRGSPVGRRRLRGGGRAGGSGRDPPPPPHASRRRAEAGRRFAAASEWIFANGNEYLRPYVFLDAGVLALHEGDDERACRLVACADRIFRETDSIPDPDDYVELEDAVAKLRDAWETDSTRSGRRVAP